MAHKYVCIFCKQKPVDSVRCQIFYNWIPSLTESILNTLEENLDLMLLQNEVKYWLPSDMPALCVHCIGHLVEIAANQETYKENNA